MKLFVVSDYLISSAIASDITFRRWQDDSPISLGGFDCVLIDMTFESEVKAESTVKLLNKLNILLEQPSFISKNQLIVIVISGTTEEEFNINRPYDPDAVNGPDMPGAFKNYSFLSELLPEGHVRAVFDDAGSHVFSVAPLPTCLYLTYFQAGPTFFNYDYDKTNEICLPVNPLAVKKEGGDICVAVELSCGRGTIIILPAYRIAEANKAFSMLRRICRSYYKKYREINQLVKIHDAIPSPIRENYVEAIICYTYDLYAASLAMCRRSLEASAIHQGAKKKVLQKKIKKLLRDKVISSYLYDIAMEVIQFGNWGAHPDKFMGREITEEDVVGILEFLRIYFYHVHTLPYELERIEERRKELKRKETV